MPWCSVLRRCRSNNFHFDCTVFLEKTSLKTIGSAFHHFSHCYLDRHRKATWSKSFSYCSMRYEYLERDFSSECHFQLHFGYGSNFGGNHCDYGRKRIRKHYYQTAKSKIHMKILSINLKLMMTCELRRSLVRKVHLIPDICQSDTWLSTTNTYSLQGVTTSFSEHLLKLASSNIFGSKKFEYQKVNKLWWILWLW